MRVVAGLAEEPASQRRGREFGLDQGGRVGRGPRGSPRRRGSRSGRPLPSSPASRCRSSRRPGRGRRPASAGGAGAPRRPAGPRTSRRARSRPTTAAASPSRAAGQISASSASTASRIAILSSASRSYEALMTSCRYWPLCRHAGPAALDRGVVEDPLDQPTDRHDVVERADRPVEPEVDARDRRGAHRARAPRGPGCGREVAGDQAADPVERDGQRRRSRRRSTLPSGGSRPPSSPSSSTSTVRTPVVSRTETLVLAEPGFQPRAVELAQRDEGDLHLKSRRGCAGTRRGRPCGRGRRPSVRAARSAPRRARSPSTG